MLAGPAFLLIAGGLVKKTVVADELARRVVDPVFNDPLGHSGPETLLAIYGFAGQIYCDFSGYTDMAIGLALLLGFRLPQNFDRPYTATSLRQFWHRWHMTLSRWLRDYLYIPLGGNRGGPRRTYRNLMLTMLLGGLWHGAAWTFVVWGAIHGRRPLGRALAARPARLASEYRRWWAGSSPSTWSVSPGCSSAHPISTVAFEVLGRVGASGPSPLVTLPVVFLAVAAIAVQAVPPGWWRAVEAWLVARPAVAQGVALGLVVVAADAAVGQQGVAPFIYYRF